MTDASGKPPVWTYLENGPDVWRVEIRRLQ